MRAGRPVFLTGGSVLVGFLNEPRITRYLDLFTTDEAAWVDGTATLHQVLKHIQARATPIHTGPEFRRIQIERGDESTMLDLVLDRTPQLFAKVKMDAIPMDSPSEIMVNKMCALVSRSEPRDFVDVAFLQSRGEDPKAALRLALQKDAGVTPEAVLMILRPVAWDRLRLPGADEALLEATRSFSEISQRRNGLTPELSPSCAALA